MRWLNLHKFLPFLAWLPRQTRASVGRDVLVGLSGAILAAAAIHRIRTDRRLAARIRPVRRHRSGHHRLPVGLVLALDLRADCGDFHRVVCQCQSARRPGQSGLHHVDPATDVHCRDLPVSARHDAFRRAGEFRFAFGGARFHSGRGHRDCPRADAQSAGP